MVLHVRPSLLARRKCCVIDGYGFVIRKMKKRVMFMVESMMVGGAERVLINLVNSLDPNKYDITVIAVFKNGVYPDYPCVFKDAWAPHVK